MAVNNANNITMDETKLTSNVNWKEIGYVTALADGVARIMGLTKLQAGEFVTFGTSGSNENEVVTGIT